MIKTAVLLAAGKSQKLDPLGTHKPLILIHGKPLIVHGVGHLLDAGVQKIFIVAGSSRDEIARVIEKFPAPGVSYEFIAGKDEENIVETFKAVTDVVSDECIIASSDLIFEKNPFLHFKEEREAEFLIDPHISHNKFCGAPIKISQESFGRVRFNPHLLRYGAYLSGVYWFSKKGLYLLRQGLSKVPRDTSLTDVLDGFFRARDVALTTLPLMTWFDINSPETLLRAEMFLRRNTGNSRLTKVRTGELKPIDATNSFLYRKESETKVTVRLGLMGTIAEYTLMDPERTASHHIILTDENVDALFGGKVYTQMKDAGYLVTKLVVPAGEATKNIRIYSDLAQRIITLGIDDQSILFALGGGMVANLAGLLASTLYRGIGLIHIPTTMMNMIDVSVSLKQGINDQRGKNLIGSYYQPLAVFIDPAISIPDWLVKDGLSEAIKHALCQDEKLFARLLSYEGNLDDAGFRTEIIKNTISLKTELMKEDMFENQRAMVLQYGHEIGHAVEFLSGFALTHGQGISIGMRVSAEIARLMGVAEKGVVDAHKNIFKKYGLPYCVPRTLEKAAILDALLFNKKTRGSDIRMVLPERVGKVWKIQGEYGIPCPPALITAALEKSNDA